MDAADLDLFERSLRHATEQHSGAALDAALDALGWVDALAAHPADAVSLLFERQGAANATSSALDRVIADALGVSASTGEGVVWPALGGTAAPGQIDDGRLEVSGLASTAMCDAVATLLVATTSDGHIVATVPTASLSLRAVSGIDPALGLVEVTGSGITVDDSSTVTAWSGAVAAAQRALGHELVGVARTMLAQACEHALGRMQFDRPIGSFQAVRHRLADSLVAIETADAVLAAAWDDDSLETAAMAKALAGRGARTAARHCQQVLAGIGFTTEHPLHRSIRRTLVLDELFGSARTLTRDLGDTVLAGRHLPPLAPL